jgi:hypothetical protein
MPLQLKLNTDESPGVATEYGIRSIPTVMLFKDGVKQVCFQALEAGSVPPPIHAVSCQPFALRFGRQGLHVSQHVCGSLSLMLMVWCPAWMRLLGWSRSSACSLTALPTRVRNIRIGAATQLQHALFLLAGDGHRCCAQEHTGADHRQVCGLSA